MVRHLRVVRWRQTRSRAKVHTGIRGACGLLVGQEAVAGVQSPPRPVQRVTGAAAVAVQVLLHPTPAGAQSVTGQANGVEPVHDGDCVR